MNKQKMQRLASDQRKEEIIKRFKEDEIKYPLAVQKIEEIIAKIKENKNVNWEWQEKDEIMKLNVIKILAL